VSKAGAERFKRIAFHRAVQTQQKEPALVTLMQKFSDPLSHSLDAYYENKFPSKKVLMPSRAQLLPAINLLAPPNNALTTRPAQSQHAIFPENKAVGLLVLPLC
jgi:DNA-binding FadR family transcriptional regulator